MNLARQPNADLTEALDGSSTPLVENVAPASNKYVSQIGSDRSSMSSRLHSPDDRHPTHHEMSYLALQYLGHAICDPESECPNGGRVAFRHSMPGVRIQMSRVYYWTSAEWRAKSMSCQEAAKITRFAVMYVVLHRQLKNRFDDFPRSSDGVTRVSEISALLQQSTILINTHMKWSYQAKKPDLAPVEQFHPIFRETESCRKFNPSLSIRWYRLPLGTEQVDEFDSMAVGQIYMTSFIEAYDYLGPFGVLWEHMAWYITVCRKKKKTHHF